MRLSLFVVLYVAAVVTNAAALQAVEPKPQVISEFLDPPAAAAPGDMADTQVARPRLDGDNGSYMIHVRRFSPATSPGFAAYLEQLNLAELQPGGSGYCVVSPAHKAVELFVRLPPSVLADQKMFADSAPTLLTVADQPVELQVGQSIRTPVAHSVDGERKLVVEKLSAGVCFTATIKSPSAKPNGSFQLLINLRHTEFFKDQTVSLDGIDYPRVAGFAAQAEVEMQAGQLLLLRGLPWDASEVASNATKDSPEGQALRPLYAVVVTRPDQPPLTRPAGVQAQITAQVTKTIPQGWKSAGLPPLIQVFELPELAVDQPGICIREADSHSSRMLHTGRHRLFTGVTRIEPQLMLGTDLLGRPVSINELYQWQVLHSQLSTNSPATRPNDGLAIFGDSVIAFESMDGDVAVFSFVMKDTVPARKRSPGGIKVGEPHHAILAEGTARLRVGETCFCRTRIEYLDAKDQPPVDAIFSLTLDSLNKPGETTDEVSATARKPGAGVK